MSSPKLAELNCPGCQHTEILATGGIVRRLASLGMLRRNHDVEWAVLWELLRSSLDNLKCTALGPSCLGGPAFEMPRMQSQRPDFIDWQ